MKFKRAFCRIALALSALLVVVAPVTSVYAILDYDILKFFADNNIIYYDPTVRTGCSYILDNGDALNSLMAYFMSLGYSKEAAAAILGSLQAESGLDPKKLEGGAIVEDNFVAYANGSKTYSGGFGLAQWTSAGRVQNLQNFANNKNQPVTSLSLQAEFIAYELANSYNYSPEQANKNSFEENVWYILKTYEAPASVIYDTSNGVNNDFVPRSLSDLNPNTTAAAYASYHTRLGYAEDALKVIISSSLDLGSNSVLTDGSQVTIIGDSITARSRAKILELLPQADIKAEQEKQFAGNNASNPSGQQIVESLIASGSLRDTVVIALGTNNTNLTTRQVDAMVAAVGAQRNLIFVNNYDDVDTDKYDHNNQQLDSAATKYDNVSIANWEQAVISAEAADSRVSYIEHETEYAVHPTIAGQELFAQTIANAVSADATSLNTCAAVGAISDPSQALPFVNSFIRYLNQVTGLNFPLQNNITVNQTIITIGHNYGGCAGASDCGQCTAIPGWFVNNYTDLVYGGGHGGFVAGNLLSSNPGVKVDLLNGKLGAFPDGIAVFSISSSSDYGHTGLVLGRDSNGNLITLENNFNDGGELVVSLRSQDNITHRNYAFFYPLNNIKLGELRS